MRAEISSVTATLYREPKDPALSHESTVGFHLKRLLNAQGYHFTRTNPSRHGLTSCTLGLRDRRLGIWLWHERYAVEAAHKAFNAGQVSLRVLRESNAERLAAQHTGRYCAPCDKWVSARETVCKACGAETAKPTR